MDAVAQEATTMGYGAMATVITAVETETVGAMGMETTETAVEAAATTATTLALNVVEAAVAVEAPVGPAVPP